MRYYGIAALALILGVGVFLHTLFYSDGWRQREKARVDLQALTASNDAAEEDLRAKRSQIEALRTRPEVQARAIRNELGYVRPGEIVLELGGQR